MIRVTIDYQLSQVLSIHKAIHPIARQKASTCEVIIGFGYVTAKSQPLTHSHVKYRIKTYYLPLLLHNLFSFFFVDGNRFSSLGKQEKSFLFSDAKPESAPTQICESP